MKSYYVTFYNNGKRICGTYKRGNNKEEACLAAEFALTCHYPNVEYTEVSGELAEQKGNTI